MNREEFLNRINKEGFSFAIDMTRWGFSDCKTLVRSRRLSEEQLYQMFVERCIFAKIQERHRSCR